MEGPSIAKSISRALASQLGLNDPKLLTLTKSVSKMFNSLLKLSANIYVLFLQQGSYQLGL